MILESYCSFPMFDKVGRKQYYLKAGKGGFFQKVRIVSQMSQSPKWNTYSKKISLTWNLKFPPISVLCNGPLPDQNVEVCLEWSPCLEGVKKHRVLSKVLLPIKKGYLLLSTIRNWILIFSQKFLQREGTTNVHQDSFYF